MPLELGLSLMDQAPLKVWTVWPSVSYRFVLTGTLASVSTSWSLVMLLKEITSGIMWPKRT